MAPRDDRVHSEHESGRFQSTDSHQQGRGETHTKTYPGQNGHQLPRLDPANGRDLGRIQPPATGIKQFKTSLVARKSAQSYQPTGRPRGRPTNKSRLGEVCSSSHRVSSTGRHQAVTRSNEAENGRYTNQRIEEDTSNARFRKHDRTKDSEDVQAPQGRAGRSDLGTYKRSGLSATTDGSSATGEYRPVNDEPSESRIKRISEINIECLPQDRNTDINRSRTLSTSQFLLPPGLGSNRSSASLRSSASALHRDYNHNSLATVHGNPETDIVAPIPTSAMSMSNGCTPPQPYPRSGRKRARLLDYPCCQRCLKPGTPTNALLRCIECELLYHSLCHRPKATPNNNIWRCQPCINSEQQSNASTPIRQSSNSTTSETSASSVTSAAIIQISTGPSFKSEESEMNGTGRPRNDHARLVDIHSYSDGDLRRKRFKGDIPPQNQWSTEDTVLGRAYGDHEYGELARSQKIFHGSQTFAVVIGSRSRSTSASADGGQSNRQGAHQDFQSSVTAKASQETQKWVTKRPSIANRSSSPPPAPPACDEDLSALKQTRLPSEIKDSQEMDYELDYADHHSPVQERSMHNYKTHDNITSDTLGRTVSYWGPPELNGPFMRYERPLPYEKSRTLPENSSPQYSPSVGDRERNENGRPTNREYREVSSPPYSPPPPDVDVSYEGPGKDPPHAPLPQMTLQEQSKNSDDGFWCVTCNFYVTNRGQYTNNTCGNCALPHAPRNSQAFRGPPQTTSRGTGRQTRYPKSFRRRARKHSKPFKSTPPTGLHSHEASKNSTPEEFRSVSSTFQTSKAIVIEKYQMKLGTPEPVPGPRPRAISVLRKNKEEEPIKNALEPRAGSCDIPDKEEKPEAVAVNEKYRRPVRSNNSTGPARKFPSTHISRDSPPPRMIKTTERSVSRNDNVLPKKTPRRPAVKNAGGSVQFTDSDDSDDPVNDIAIIQTLEKKLEEQKGFTKNQRNEARRWQERYAEVQEQLKASRAQVRKIKKSNPVRLDQNDEKKACDQAVKLTTGNLAAMPVKLKDLYKDIDFTASFPWPCPPEPPEPDPSTFRKPGWRKQQKKTPEYDIKRLMKVHLHRQLTRVQSQPLKITPGSLHDLVNSHGDSRSNSLDDEYNEYSPRGPETTLDELLGFPENMVPAVKDGVLGFRPGIINQRTRRLDRNVQHYKVRTPGALLDRI